MAEDFASRVSGDQRGKKPKQFLIPFEADMRTLRGDSTTFPVREQDQQHLPEAH